ncbi:MAG: hypothetical protein ACRC33_26250, partial [Gemmataceae bacterium]
ERSFTDDAKVTIEVKQAMRLGAIAAELSRVQEAVSEGKPLIQATLKLAQEIVDIVGEGVLAGGGLTRPTKISTMKTTVKPGKNRPKFNARDAIDIGGGPQTPRPARNVQVDQLPVVNPKRKPRKTKKEDAGL